MTAEGLEFAHGASDAEAVAALLGHPLPVYDRCGEPVAPVRGDAGEVPTAAVATCRWVLADCDHDWLPVEVSLPGGTTVPGAYLRYHPGTAERVRVVPMPGCVGIQRRRGLDTVGRPRWLPYPADVREIGSSEFTTELSYAVRQAVDALTPSKRR